MSMKYGNCRLVKRAVTSKPVSSRSSRDGTQKKPKVQFDYRTICDLFQGYQEDIEADDDQEEHREPDIIRDVQEPKVRRGIVIRIGKS